MSPYDIMKAFFSENSWEEIGRQEKLKNFFLINRTMSIIFPLQANAFNNTKIDPISVIDFWKSTLNQKYKAPPGWFFTATKKKEKKETFSPSEEVSSFIKLKYEISGREIKDLSMFYPKEFKSFCKSIEDVLT